MPMHPRPGAGAVSSSRSLRFRITIPILRAYNIRAGRNQRGPPGSYGFDGPPQAYHALTGAAAKRRTALQLHPLRFTQQRGPTTLFRIIGSLAKPPHGETAYADARSEEHTSELQ